MCKYYFFTLAEEEDPTPVLINTEIKNLKTDFVMKILKEEFKVLDISDLKEESAQLLDGEIHEKLKEIFNRSGKSLTGYSEFLNSVTREELNCIIYRKNMPKKIMHK